MSISDQPKAISILSYLLFYLFKQNTTSIIPAQLCNFDDVKSIYKFSCLNEIFKSKSSSKDRLRRVQGLSGFPGIDACANENGSFLSLEDPVVCTSYGIILANINRTAKSNVSITDLPLSLNTFEQMDTVILSVQKIKTKLNAGRLY